MSCDANAVTVAELKEKLKVRKLSTAGSKAELIARLFEADPEGSWLRENELESVVRIEEDENTTQGDIMRREMELCRREKELVERELELARREISMLRGQRRDDSIDETRESAARNGEEVFYARPRANLTIIADLLNDFDGISADFDTWERQARFLKTTYRLDDDCARLLIGMRLKKRAFEWFHSRSEHISMSFERLLEELRTMFRHHESKLYLRKRFENRVWKKEETFQEYTHDKIIMGNRVPIERDELLEYVIDGIPDTALRDQARIQRFASVDGLLKAFEKITLRDRGATGSARYSGDKKLINDKKKTSTDVKRCFNCGEREHVSANCPTKTLGAKCFGCGRRGHIAAKCPEKGNNTGKSVVASISRISCKRYTCEVILNGQIIVALIDSGSDISIMRETEYAMRFAENASVRYKILRGGRL